MDNGICHIDWFAERDIDVWLAEELRVNAAFAKWILQKANVTQAAEVPAFETRVSLVTDRETDVQALFCITDGTRFVLLVEDKIKADFQPNQMDDYVKRGDLGRSEGKWDNFGVVVFAPSYRFPMHDLPDSVKTISFEEAADFLLGLSPIDDRVRYRAEFLRRAAQPRVVVAGSVSEFVVKWWEDANALIRSKFGTFYPPQNPTKDSYVNPRWNGQPSYLRLDIKGHKGEVALSLKGISEASAREILASSNTQGFIVKKNIGWIDPVICVTETLPKYAVGDDLTEAGERVLAAYAAGYRLYELWQANREKFERGREK